MYNNLNKRQRKTTAMLEVNKRKSRMKLFFCLSFNVPPFPRSSSWGYKESALLKTWNFEYGQEALISRKADRKRFKRSIAQNGESGEEGWGVEDGFPKAYKTVFTFSLVLNPKMWDTIWSYILRRSFWIRDKSHRSTHLHIVPSSLSPKTSSCDLKISSGVM